MNTALFSTLSIDSEPQTAFALLAFAAATIWLTTKQSSEKESAHRIAHTLPGSLPVIGDLVEVTQNEHRFHDWLSETSLRLHGQPWRVRIPGQKDLVVVCTPDAFEDVLVKQFNKFPIGRDQAEVLETLLGRSILTFDGEEWHRQRKAAAKFFTAKSLRTCMMQTMSKNVAQLYEAIDATVAQKQPINLTKIFLQFTLQTFCEVGLGADLRWIGEESNPLEAVADVASPATMRRLRLPTFYWKLERFLNVGVEAEMASAMDSVRLWFRDVISATLERLRQRQAAPPANIGESEAVKSVVELFFEHSREDQVGLRLDDMVEFLLSFVFAAQDTTALTLTRFFWVLKQFPHVEERLRKEMHELLPRVGATNDTYLTTDHLTNFVYLDATIREILRLYPTAPLIQKQAAEATVICGDIAIQKGDMIGMSTYAMGRNPDVWGPDAAEFKPERWINETTGELRTFPAHKAAAFGAGPRICIGMKLAMLELRVVAANLLHRYKFTLAQPNNGDYIVAVTLPMKSPLVVRAERVAEDTT